MASTILDARYLRQRSQVEWHAAHVNKSPLVPALARETTDPPRRISLLVGSMVGKWRCPALTKNRDGKLEMPGARHPLRTLTTETDRRQRSLRA
jgi:hypothetical protein